MIYIDKYGWPIEFVKGHPIINFLRIIVYTDTANTIRNISHPAWIRDKNNPNALIPITKIRKK
jgi:hypothetical protein